MTESHDNSHNDLPALAFTVHGEPAPAGSKRAFNHRTTGRVIVTDDSKRSRPWKTQVAREAAEVFPAENPWNGPLKVTLRFYRPRPKSHYGTGRNKDLVKPGAPARPIVKPDVLKLARAVEDALSGIVYTDDAQIVDETLCKYYGTARVEIEIERLEPAPHDDDEQRDDREHNEHGDEQAVGGGEDHQESLLLSGGR